MTATPSGLGAILTTETEHVDLGRIGERSLRGRVEHRRVRFALGRRRGFSLTMGRLRPVAVEVTEPGRVYEVAIPAVVDPRVRAVRRTLALWLLSLGAVWWVRRRRRSSGRGTLDA